MARSEIRGAREVASALRGIARGITPATVRRAHEEGLSPMQDSARQNFVANGSYKTGVVPRDIAIVHTAPLTSNLAMTGMGAKLGHLIELGTAPHEQPARGSWHPGAAPKPFMRPAFDSVSSITLQRAGAVYGAELGRLAAVLRAK